jgi:hypothetical protein
MIKNGHRVANIQNGSATNLDRWDPVNFAIICINKVPSLMSLIKDIIYLNDDNLYKCIKNLSLFWLAFFEK